MDMISVNIIRNGQYPIILRRYLFELHTIHDPCLRAIYDYTKELIHHLDHIFAQSIQMIKIIKPLHNPNFNKAWTFQLRSSSNPKNNKSITIEHIIRQKPIYKEFILINQQSNLLSDGKQSIISNIKSLHSERLKLQFMCEDDKYEQDKFQQWNQYLLDNISFDQQDTDIETDSDIDDVQVQESFEDSEMSSSSGQKLNESKLWPLTTTTTKNRPLCTIDEEEEEAMDSTDVEQKSKKKKQRKRDRTISIDSDVLVDRYHSTQKITRENIDTIQYLSDDERQEQSPYSPDNVWQDEDEDEDEDL